MKNKKVNLNDICFFQEGPGVRKHQYCTKGVKLINVSNLVNGEIDLSNSNRYISQEEAYGRYKHFLIDEGDLIIASSGIKVEYLDKKIAFIKKENLPLCMNTSTIRFKVKNKNELDILYLSYFLKSKNFKNQISKLITGSAQLNFGGSHLKKINLFLPELNVQKKVSTLLLLIDNVIKDMQRKLSILEQLKKSLFTTMFGDIKTNNKNWEIVKLEKYINIIGGYAFKNIDFKSTGIPLIRIGNINSGQFKSTNLVFIKENKKFEKFKVFPNDILISLTGTVGKDDYGNACILGNSYSEYYLNQRNAKIEIIDKINKNFFLEIIKIKEVKKKLTGISRGIRQANISNKDIYNLSIPLPPIELQNKFAERIEKIEKLKFEIEKSIEVAQNLYDSLISKYFDN